MATTKPQKDKPYVSSPRLAPRPTAASTARAARNATNRNLTIPAQRQSPMRSPPSPTSSKIKTAVSRNGQRSDSKTDMKIIPVKQEVEPTVNFKEDEIDVANIDNQQATNKSTHDLQNNCPDFVVTENIEEITASAVLDPTIEQNSTQRPPTPIQDQPQTPKNISSRPQTPRMPSRPSTPLQSALRHSTPVSRPNTPQKSAQLTRPRTPTMPIRSLSRPVTPVISLKGPTPKKDENNLKASYFEKQKQFHRMKRELDLKQQAILEVFDGLQNLREQMSREGINAGGEGQAELVVFNVADWAPNEVTQLCRDAVASSATDGAVELFNTTVPIDECALAEVDSKVIKIPACFADLCLQAFTARQELIDWIKNLIEKNEIVGNEAVDKIAQYNSQGLEMCEALRNLKTHADNAIDAITLLTKRVCRERSTLVAVGETLVREVARLRQDLDARAANLSELRETQADTEIPKILEETRRELEEERSAKLALKEKLATTESQLRQTRMRVSKMDRQLREAEASIASLTGTVKSLEDQSRQREVQLEARARKLKESLKTGEITSSNLAQQRDALQAEVNDLKEQIQSMTTQHKSEIQEFNRKLKDMTSVLEEQKQISQRESEQKQHLETILRESQSAIEELKAKITELENSKPNPDLPTEREMDLWAELQATKDTLRFTEEEMATCKMEKISFLESLTKIAESENKVGMQQKLTSELLNKEEIIGKMQIQIRDLTKHSRLYEKKVNQYEQYIRDLQAHNRASAKCQETPNGNSYQDLQEEIMNLRMSLLDAVHRNEELSEILLQKDQQLEQQDKTSRAQARVIKVREELINMLKNKETEQSRELTELQQDLEHRMNIVDEVNKQIAAKADEIQELFSTLENKQQQIHRLEKIVLALEEQQRRAQVQRTRHEEKIAALEHELAASGNRRERKFLFF
ncbi:paramyosin-like [Melitaea cinxia]|uniref:paramyosin-like n=1 Tax=Melitaea cinxia TaxID=113334 RepID=UPI001E27354D|nr:paramyosin-like [Melitaea cinxia]